MQALLEFNMILEIYFNHHDNLVNFTVFWRGGGGQIESSKYTGMLNK